MAKSVLVTITSFEPDSGPYYIYSDADNYAAPVTPVLARGQLLLGYTATVPDSATTIKLASIGVCKNYQLLPITD